VATTLVEVTVKNSPHKDRTIVVYYSKFIESLMRAYVMIIGHNVLQKNQIHIGRRCAILQSALVCSVLKTAIQQIVQEQCIILMKQYGLKTLFPIVSEKN